MLEQHQHCHTIRYTCNYRTPHQQQGLGRPARAELGAVVMVLVSTEWGRRGESVEWRQGWGFGLKRGGSSPEVGGVSGGDLCHILTPRPDSPTQGFSDLHQGFL